VSKRRISKLKVAGDTPRDKGSEAAHRRRGNALLEQGKLDQAAVCYSRALEINPDSPETINSLGVLLFKAGRIEQAVVCYEKAVSLKADYAEAHSNLGIALKNLGRLDEALASMTLSLHHQPHFAAAHNNIGEVLLARGEFQAAKASLRKAIELQPGFVEAHLTLGNVFRAQGLLSKAVQAYEQGIRLDPKNGGLYNNLAETLKDQGELEQAAEAFHKALALEAGTSRAFSNLLCLYAFTRHISPEAEKALAMGWEKSVLSDDDRDLARKRSSAVFGAFPACSRAGRRLRLGFVSGDLGGHAVAYFLEPILEQIDRSRFHVALFPTFRRFDPHARRLRDLAASYIPLFELTDSQAADRIRLEQVDVLIDLSGHTFGGRLGVFAHRAAPVQCTYIGYTGTTGLTEMDWIIAEHCLAKHFTERVWELPRLGVCYRGEVFLPESTWVPDPDGTIWLGSFNRYNKIRQETLGLWAKVLHALPEAKLLLEDGTFCEEETHQRILATLSTFRVSEDRVTFIPFIPGHERHMALYHHLDIALDTIPLNSGTTGFDALWMGVPLVALEGNWIGGRIASQVVKAFGRPDWVARNEEEYVSIVCTLARDVEGRTQQRQGQRSRMQRSPLCDAVGMARCLEGAFQEMYDDWLAGARDSIVSTAHPAK
jgi:protein O-GlcNAc transferase